MNKLLALLSVRSFGAIKPVLHNLFPLATHFHWQLLWLAFPFLTKS